MKDFLIGAAVTLAVSIVSAFLDRAAPAAVDPVDLPVYRDYR